MIRADKYSLTNKQMQEKNSTQRRVVLIFYFSGIQSIEQVCFEHVAILSLLIKNIIIINDKLLKLCFLRKQEGQTSVAF